jgi:crotonobetainyl-CoA:carnitine CoA-transferase CaiB-like acyl-CoA transferase
VEGALNAAAELVLEKTAYGNSLQRDGNRSPNIAPQGLYRARGDEQWLAISVTSDEQWRALVDYLGAPEWAKGSDLASVAGRRARHDELDAHLSVWCLEQDAAAVAEALVARGVPAALGWDPRRLYEHPQLQARGYYETIAHPVVGEMATPTWPFRMRSIDRWLRAPAPTLGQHNHEILVGDLGMDEARLEALRSAGVIGDHPIGV